MEYIVVLLIPLLLVLTLVTLTDNNDGVNLSNTLTFVGMPTVNGIVVSRVR